MLIPLLLLTFALLLGAAVVERRSRRGFIDDVPAFTCRLRAVGLPPGDWRWLRRRWTRRMQAYWCDDMLIVRRGPVFSRRTELLARISPTGVYALPFREDRRCGRNAIAVRLWNSDGAVVEVAATEADRTELVGPFLAAAISDLPKAPAFRREI
jgi:hypothetical protein